MAKLGKGGGGNWYGDDIRKRVEKAARMGVNRTMAVAVAEAKASHPFTNRTGTAERSIRIVRAAITHAGETVGLWGSALVDYFKYLEFGTKLTTTRVSIRQQLRQGTGAMSLKTSAADKLPWKGGSWGPTLQPAAAKVYPLLGEMIRKAYQELR